jgi:hypothetical protein
MLQIDPYFRKNLVAYEKGKKKKLKERACEKSIYKEHELKY